MVMFSSMTALSLFILFVIFSILVANLANIVSTDNEIAYKLNHNDKINLLQNQDQVTINDENDHLMWFVQISDIHISMFDDESRIRQLNSFVNETLDIIQPSVVLASGDITDARDSDRLGSRQFLKEWKIYDDILRSNNIDKRTTWLDIRGNHDNFNVPGVDSNLNYFNKFSMQGSRNQRSYLFQKTVSSEKYSFIAIDACLEPGPKRPFNFIGLLDVADTRKLIELNEIARKNGGNYTVWFGHYPTSCIISPGAGNGGLREIIGKFDESYVYLCGHLHTQAGIVPKMYTMHRAGFLELELGDWKDNRLFRLAAFDHGLFSFVDVKYDSWPIVLVTNPKEILFNIPSKENINLQLNSIYIRLLIFAPTKVMYCGVQIEQEEWLECTQKSKNLFVVPWIPSNYKTGIHHMNIQVLTENGQSKKIRHEFSLDGTKVNFSLLGRFLLMIDMNKAFQAFFGIALFFCIVPLCMFRIFHELVLAEKLKKPRMKLLCMKDFIRKMWILSSVNRIFMPLILHCVYIAIGPWAIGDVIDGHIGIVFVWGIFVNNSYIPGTLTYVYGFFQLTFCQLPLIFIYANILYNRYRLACCETIKTNNKITKYFKHLPFVMIILIEMLLASFFWWAYGTLAFIIGPFRTWSVILHILLWYLCYKIPEESLRPAIQIWNT